MENKEEIEFHQANTYCSKHFEKSYHDFAGIVTMFLKFSEIMNRNIQNRKALIFCDDCAKGLKIIGVIQNFLKLHSL